MWQYGSRHIAGRSAWGHALTCRLPPSVMATGSTEALAALWRSGLRSHGLGPAGACGGGAYEDHSSSSLHHRPPGPMGMLWKRGWPRAGRLPPLPRRIASMCACWVQCHAGSGAVAWWHALGVFRLLVHVRWSLDACACPARPTHLRVHAAAYAARAWCARGPQGAACCTAAAGERARRKHLRAAAARAHLGGRACPAWRGPRVRGLPWRPFRLCLCVPCFALLWRQANLQPHHARCQPSTAWRKLAGGV